MNIRQAGIVSLKAGSKASPNIKAHISGTGTQFELVTQPVTQPTEASDPELLSQHEAGEKPLRINGRGDRIRTCDIYVPNVALYQSELRPVREPGQAPGREVYYKTGSGISGRAADSGRWGKGL